MSELPAYYPRRTGDVWRIAFDEDGLFTVTSNPLSDFWVPVPEAYASKAGAEQGIAVLNAWLAPTEYGGAVLALDALRATPAWQGLLRHLPAATVGSFIATEFIEASRFSLTAGQPGGYDHYVAMVMAGVQVVI